MERTKCARGGDSMRAWKRQGPALAGAVLAAVAGWSSVATAQTPPPQQPRLGLQPVITSGLSKPLFLTTAPGEPNNLYIVEQGNSSPTDPSSAKIRVYNQQTRTLSDFATITGITNIGNEQGLLGLAFHPNYAQNGRFFVNVTTPGGPFPRERTTPSQMLGNGVTQIREYRRSASNPAVADPNYFALLMSYDQPQRNHNGGWIGFSPRPGDEGNLYIMSGDGGGADDDDEGHNPTIGNGQDRTTLLGKALRINVDRDDFGADATRNYGIPANNPYATATDGSRPEIFVTGLRNPFRASFDRASGDFFIGDVGQVAREELDLQPASNPGGGENYGWRYREGTIPEPIHGNDPRPPGNPVFTEPIHDYGRNVGATIIGGYVYNGDLIDGLQGTYIFGDYISGRIFTLTRDAAGNVTVVDRSEEMGSIPLLSLSPTNFSGLTSFGEDTAGEIYVIGRDGIVYQIVPEPSSVLALGAGFSLLVLRRQRRQA